MGTLKRAIGYPLAAGVGGSLGYIVSQYYRFLAEANVKVRPEIAKVDFITAYFADHGSDWIVYNYGNEITTIAAVIGAGVAATLYHILSK